VVAALTGGLVLLAVFAIVDLFGGGFIDGFIRGSILPGLTGIALPSVALPLAGAFAALGVNMVQTTEATAPSRTFTVAGLSIPLDRANDVIVRML
jgi:hypothetical protein